MALLLVAVHFAIQVQAQQRAELLVDRWTQKSGMQVGHVRYHLLRNALRLSRVSIRRDGLRLDIGQALLQADPETLLGSEPVLRQLVLDGVDAELSFAGPAAPWSHDPLLQRFWAGAKAFRARGRVSIQLADGKPLQLTDSDLLLEKQPSGRQLLRGSAHLAGAVVRVRWKSGEVPDAGGSGALEWRGLHASTLAAAFGLSRQVDGGLGGSLEWRADASRGGYALSGQTQWLAGAPMPQSLLWQGRLNRDGWNLKLIAQEWPLDLWQEAMPVIGDRVVASARLTAEARLAGRWTAASWQLSSAGGKLSDVRMVEPAGSAGADWRIGSIGYESLEANAETHRLRVGRADVATAEIAMRPEASAEPAGQMAGWEASVRELLFDGLVLRLELPRGSLRLPALAGAANWEASGDIGFALAQKGSDSSGWRLKGEAKARDGTLSDAAFSVRAAALSIGQLRPLLPLVPVAQADLPVALGGSADLDLDLGFHAGAWRLKGIATAENVSLAYAGDEWSAEKLSLEIGQAGTQLAEQVVTELDVSGWRYITPMQPLTAEPEQGGAAATSWWKEALREGGWKFERISLSGGSVSIGRADLLWARDVEISLHNLQPSTAAAVTASAILGGGKLAANGSWDVLAMQPRFVGDIRLQDAQPFFLGDWLHASGAPRLIRGRLSAALQVSDAGDGRYHVATDWSLSRPMVEAGAFPDDPLLSRIGFRTSDALFRLGNTKGVARLTSTFDGGWQQQPLTLDYFGQQLLAAVSAGIQTPTELAAASTIVRPLDARVRMHESSSLTHNERTRLRKVWRELAAHRQWVVDLVPRLPSGDIDAALIRRTRFTQSLIEGFFVDRGISPSRIYAVWPMPVHQVGEVGGIQVLAGVAR